MKLLPSRARRISSEEPPSIGRNMRMEENGEPIT